MITVSSYFIVIIIIIEPRESGHEAMETRINRRNNRML